MYGTTGNIESHPDKRQWWGRRRGGRSIGPGPGVGSDLQQAVEPPKRRGCSDMDVYSVDQGKTEIREENSLAPD